MFPSLLLLLVLIVTAPLALIFDGPIVHGLVMATAAVSIAIIGWQIRPGEASFLSFVIRPIAIIAAFAAIWILFQVLPLRAAWLVSPVWDSAAAALRQPLGGSISIDPGATLISLSRYLSCVAITFVAAVIALNRRHAAWLLFALLAVTTVIALMILSGFTFLSPSADLLATTGATDSAGLGIVFAAAAALYTLERSKKYGNDHGTVSIWFWFTVGTYLVAAVICFLAIVVHGTSQILFATTCGVATLAAAMIIRRFQFGLWGRMAIVSVALVVAIATVALRPGSRTINLTLAFAAPGPAPLIAVTQRILTETGWMGTGAGTFAAVLPIYRDIDEQAADHIAPTAAAAIAVEMGQPFLWAILAATVAFVVILVRGALKRGRDWFYAAAGASCIVTIMILAFVNIGLFSTAVLVSAAAAIGIGIAQSKSRST